MSKYLILSEQLRVSGFVCTLEEDEVKACTKNPSFALRFNEKQAREIADNHNLKYKTTAIIISSEEMYKMINYWK